MFMPLERSTIDMVWAEGRKALMLEHGMWYRCHNNVFVTLSYRGRVAVSRQKRKASDGGRSTGPDSGRSGNVNLHRAHRIEARFTQQEKRKLFGW